MDDDDDDDDDDNFILDKFQTGFEVVTTQIDIQAQ
jgi:hypothetical protein